MSILLQHHPSWRRAFMFWPILTMLAVAALISGITYLIVPATIGSSAIADATPALLARVWCATYALGGGLVLRGLYRADARWEVAGLLLLSGCYTSYGLGVVAERGLPAGSVGAPLYLALGIGCLVRAILLRFEPDHGAGE